MRTPVVPQVALAVALGACASDDPGGRAAAPADAGAGDAAADPRDAGPPVPLPKPPASPAPPRLTDWDCPSGWHAKPLEDGHPWAFSACEPAGFRAEPCEGASMQLPDDLRCRRVGTQCPGEGERWPSAPALRTLAPGFEGAIWYVDPAAAPGGHGSLERPLRMVPEALRRVRDGDIVALAAGTHAGPAKVARRVALVGASRSSQARPSSRTCSSPPSPRRRSSTRTAPTQPRSSARGWAWGCRCSDRPPSTSPVWRWPRAGSTTVRGADVYVHDMLAAWSGETACALLVADGAHLTAERVALARVPWVSVTAASRDGAAQSRIDLAQVHISETVPAPCGALPAGHHGACMTPEGRSMAAGIGLLARDRAVVRLDGFAIVGSALAGVVVALDATVEGRSGVIRGNAIGLNVMVPGFDASSLFDQVYLYDNNQDISAEDLPLPDPAAAIANRW